MPREEHYADHAGSFCSHAQCWEEKSLLGCLVRKSPSCSGPHWWRIPPTCLWPRERLPSTQAGEALRSPFFCISSVCQWHRCGLHISQNATTFFSKKLRASSESRFAPYRSRVTNLHFLSRAAMIAWGVTTAEYFRDMGYNASQQTLFCRCWRIHRFIESPREWFWKKKTNDQAGFPLITSSY